MNPTPLKPFLRWAGSKKKLVPVLSGYWDNSYSRYIEPFMGSACLFFALKPRRALLADLNEELVVTYKTIRETPELVFQALAKMPLGREAYYTIRGELPTNGESVRSAARFIYLNRFCFNGLYRTNLKGAFNVPYGGEKSGQLPSLQALQSLSKTLKRASLQAGDFEKVLNQAKSGDFVYLDPPFAVENRRVFRQYAPQNFGIEDLERLALKLEDLDRLGVAFVVSYAYCSEALHLFNGWPKRKVFVRRNIAGFATNRRFAAELIVSNIYT